MLNEASIAEVDSYGLGPKTDRGDRAAHLLTPEVRTSPHVRRTPHAGPHGAPNRRQDESELFSQMSLAMTRSLGDFYHQAFGVIHVPEVRVLDLSDEEHAGSRCVLLLASDGIWDHWTFEGAMASLVDRRTGYTSADLSGAMFERSRAKGWEVFGDSADNLTGIAVNMPTAKAGPA